MLWRVSQLVGKTRGEMFPSIVGGEDSEGRLATVRGVYVCRQQLERRNEEGDRRLADGGKHRG
jgi:hypothetical protein